MVKVTLPLLLCSKIITCKAFLFQMNEGKKAIEMAVKRQEYHHDCIFDICGAKNPDEAMCNALKTFAQECAYLGVTVRWRSPERCRE